MRCEVLVFRRGGVGSGAEGLSTFSLSPSQAVVGASPVTATSPAMSDDPPSPSRLPEFLCPSLPQNSRTNRLSNSSSGWDLFSRK